ncbi:MAG: hypothetical protein M3440_06920 [Chloroflexota bacterium]|nr:hypothetical protein [Chloroflexota bacterium]
MPTFLSDSMTDTEGTLLSAHVGETGATWTIHPMQAATSEIASNRVRSSATTSVRSIYYASGSPANADYDVEGVAYLANVSNEVAVAGRMDVTAETMYYFSARGSSGDYRLAKSVAGTGTQLGSVVLNTYTALESITIKLEMRGDQISAYVNGTLIIGPITDTAITAAGKAGVRFFGPMTDTSGVHHDSITAMDPPATVQTARPTTDVTDGTWTDQAGGTSLFAAIDEAIASDADYIQSATATATADVAEVALGSITDPAVSTGHVVRYRYGKDTAAGDVVNLTVSLRQGTGTEIAAWTHTDIGVGPTDVVQTLTAAQADAVTDYSALRLRFSSVKA